MFRRSTGLYEATFSRLFHTCNTLSYVVFNEVDKIVMEYNIHVLADKDIFFIPVCISAIN